MNSYAIKGASFCEPSKGKLVKLWREKSSTESYFLHQVEYIEVSHKVDYVQIDSEPDKKTISIPEDKEPNELPRHQEVYLKEISSEQQEDIDRINNKEQDKQTLPVKIPVKIPSAPTSCSSQVSSTKYTEDEKPNEKLNLKSDEKPTEKSLEKLTRKSTEKSTEKSPEKPVHKSPEKSTHKSPEKSSEKSPEKTTRKSSEKSPEKLTDKSPEKSTQKSIKISTVRSTEKSIVSSKRSTEELTGKLVVKLDKSTRSVSDNSKKSKPDDQEKTQFDKVVQNRDKSPESSIANDRYARTSNEKSRDNGGQIQHDIVNSASDWVLSAESCTTRSLENQNKRRRISEASEYSLIEYSKETTKDGSIEEDSDMDAIFENLASETPQRSPERSLTQQYRVEFGTFVRLLDNLRKTDNVSRKKIDQIMKYREDALARLAPHGLLFSNLDHVTEWDTNILVPATDALSRLTINQVKKGMRNGKLYNISRFQLKAIFPWLPCKKANAAQKMIKIFRCALCSKNSPAAYDIYLHMERIHTSSLLQCTRCEQLFACSSHAEIHRANKCT